MNTRMILTSFMEVYRRIQHATDTRTQSEVAKALGVRQPSIADAKRRNVIPASWYALLSEKYDLSQDWLRYGAGAMYVRAKRGDALQAPPAAGEPEDSALWNDPAAKSVLVTAYFMHSSGEICSVAELEPAGKIAVPAGFAGPDMLVLRSHANDMAPAIILGAYLGVNTADPRPLSGGIFVLKHAHMGLLARRVFLDYGNNRYLLRCDAGRHPEGAIAAAEWAERVVGRVHWIMQKIV